MGEITRACCTNYVGLLIVKHDTPYIPLVISWFQENKKLDLVNIWSTISL